MSSIVLTGDTSGTITVSAPAVAGTRTLTLPAATGTAILEDASGVLQMNSGYGSNAAAYGCRAWVNFNGTGTVAIRDSGNVTSITDNATGNYTVNFSTAIEDANYCALITSGSAGTYSVTNPDFIAKASTYAVGSVTVRIAGASGGTRDENAVNVAIFR